MSSCVTFWPTELQITPDALKFEIFRSFGVRLQENEKMHTYFLWNFRVVVDSNVYYYLLKYLLERKIKGVSTPHSKYCNTISKLLSGTNVRHRDVAFNLMSWILYNTGLKSVALIYLHLSWKEMQSLDLCYMILTEEMKHKQYQFNAAKLHTLVILYKTWLERIGNKIHECFHFFCFSRGCFKKCNRFKTAIYCSRKCQRKIGRFIKLFAKSSESIIFSEFYRTEGNVKH